MLTGYNKCPECGKAFYCQNRDEWAYKRCPRKGHSKTKVYCSWTCMRADERRIDEQRRAGEAG